MILVVGATGALGSEICRLLAADGKSVRALVRSTSNPAKVAELKQLSSDVVAGDLKDRRSLDAACRGVTAVLTTASSTFARQAGDSIGTVDSAGQLDLVDAATRAGVAQMVLVSFPQTREDFPLQSAKRQVERRLIDGAMAYTILQPTFFMEVWFSPAVGFDVANGKVQLYGTGQNPISWISYRDVARLAASVVGHPGARNSVLKLGGPEALRPMEVVRIFEDLTGRKFDVQFVPEAALRARKAASDDELQQSFAGLMLYYAAGEIVDMRETLRRFPGKLLSVREFAQTQR